MLTVREYDDGEAFWREVAAPMRARPLPNNVFVGVASTIRTATAGVLRAGVFEGERVILGALVTPPYRVNLADLGDGERGIDALTQHLAASGKAVPGVFGTLRLSKAFVAAWERASGRPVSVQNGHGRLQNLYQVTEVRPPEQVSGHMRAATREEREINITWEIGFAVDAELPPSERDPAHAARVVDEGQARGNPSYMWVVDGRPVATARLRLIAQDGARISGVYTPPSLRGRGYAAAVTAALSQRVLDQGMFCCLFADAANALTNRLYQRIGYVKVGTYADIIFETRERTT
jgi:GNAT superfamily N-acetyltransferase